MPPRLNKRQQRELEELETLSKKSDLVAADDESDPEPVNLVKAKPAGGFAAVSNILYLTNDSDLTFQDSSWLETTKKAMKTTLIRQDRASRARSVWTINLK